MGMVARVASEALKAADSHRTPPHQIPLHLHAKTKAHNNHPLPPFLPSLVVAVTSRSSRAFDSTSCSVPLGLPPHLFLSSSKQVIL
ncbi:hypothetical protein K1719_029464 [Acacia pycnantha]|nr:hypothetical protein K1719_029464 [Acacia pycnantha]